MSLQSTTFNRRNEVIEEIIRDRKIPDDFLFTDTCVMAYIYERVSCTFFKLCIWNREVLEVQLTFCGIRGVRDTLPVNYVRGGQLVRIKIKIENGTVTFYSTGKDTIGRENWVAVVPRGSITKTHSTFDGSLAREFDYKSTIYVQVGYQNQSLTIYF